MASPGPVTTMPARYTCISCRVAFADAEGQRSHYKTDWHRYNLKRRVAEMAPLSAEEFRRRVVAQRSKAEEDALQAQYTGECGLCEKKFSSPNALLSQSCLWSLRSAG